MELDPDNGFHPKMQIELQPNIGLDDNIRISVVGLLNKILADEAILTTKTRNALWNIHGAHFLELHSLYDLQYLRLNAISDEIAERVRMLGGFALGSLQGFLDLSRLGEQSGQVPHLLYLLADHEAEIRFLREDADQCSEEFEDLGTHRMLVGIISLHERMAWMLRSYIDNN
jgi:starvation-inducible DNA-binding protein